MKHLSLPTLVFFFLIGGNVYGQKKPVVKDSIPQEKKYVFVIEPAGFHVMDSILATSYGTTGYELPTKSSDAIKSGLAMIINYFRSTAKYQDSVYNSQLKPKGK